MKLIGSNNQARDNCDKVIEVLANINGYLVFLMNSRYTVILRRNTSYQGRNKARFDTEVLAIQMILIERFMSA